VTSAGPDPASLVDLDRYPILDLSTPEGVALVARTRASMAATGACEMADFLTAAGLATCIADGRDLEFVAHRSRGATTPYLEQPGPEWEADHPRLRRNPFSLGAVAYDQFPASSPIRALYEWEPLRAFVAAVLSCDVHRYDDPLGALNLAVMTDGDVLGWHFDQTDFVVSLALRSADAGGEFEVVPGTRTIDDESYARVASVLDGVEAPEVLPNVAGTLLVFAGRWSLHQVSTIRGATSRLMVLFGFDSKPGTRSTTTLQQSRYGRTA